MVPAEVLMWEFIVQCPVETFTLVKAEDNVHLIAHNYHFSCGFPGGSDGKVSACNAGDPGLIPGSGRFPGEGNSNPLQYSFLEKSLDRGAW